MIYDVIIITDRSYGLYSGYSHYILGLKVAIIYDSNPIQLKEKIFTEENEDFDLLILKKINVNVFYFNTRNLEIRNNVHTFTISDLETINVVYILSEKNPLITKQNVSIENFEFSKNQYVVGEKAIYDGKIYTLDFYFGEINFLSQQIYQKIHFSTESITIHSTDKFIN